MQTRWGSPSSVYLGWFLSPTEPPSRPWKRRCGLRAEICPLGNVAWISTSPAERDSARVIPGVASLGTTRVWPVELLTRGTTVPFAVAVDGLDDHRVHEQFRCIPLVFPASQAPLNSPAYRRRLFTTYGLRNLSTVHTLLLLLTFSVVGLQCFTNTLVVQ